MIFFGAADIETWNIFVNTRNAAHIEESMELRERDVGFLSLSGTFFY